MLAKLRTSLKQPGMHYYEHFCFNKFPGMRIACVQRIAAAAGVEGMRVGDPPLCIPTATAIATSDPDSKTVPSLQ